MALFSECTVKYVSKLLDTADIVRDAMLRQLAQPRIYDGRKPSLFGIIFQVLVNDMALVTARSLFFYRDRFGFFIGQHRIATHLRTEYNGCSSARKSFSGAIDGRPILAYRLLKPGFNRCSASSVMARSGRNGCSSGNRCSGLT